VTSLTRVGRVVFDGLEDACPTVYSWKLVIPVNAWDNGILIFGMRMTKDKVRFIIG